MNKGKWYFFVNASAGKGSNHNLLKKVSKELHLAGIEHEGYSSDSLEKFRPHIHQEIDRGTRHFIAVGGDGSLHHLINGLYAHPSVPLSEFTVACLPMGSGNDWSRTYHFPHSLRKCVRLIAQGHTQMQDLAVLRHLNREYIVVNNCGLGYDALVLKDTLNLPHPSPGSMKYLYSVLRLLFAHKSSKYRLEIDGTTFETDVFSLTIGNCAYNGGGIKQLAHAVPNDGKMDMVLVRTISPWTILRNVYRLFLGTMDHVKHVSSLHARQIRVDPGPSVYIEADGELIGTGSIDLKILPNALRFILPSL